MRIVRHATLDRRCNTKHRRLRDARGERLDDGQRRGRRVRRREIIHRLPKRGGVRRVGAARARDGKERIAFRDAGERRARASERGEEDAEEGHGATLVEGDAPLGAEAPSQPAPEIVSAEDGLLEAVVDDGREVDLRRGRGRREDDAHVRHQHLAAHVARLRRRAVDQSPSSFPADQPHFVRHETVVVRVRAVDGRRRRRGREEPEEATHPDGTLSEARRSYRARPPRRTGLID
mmetsp:Transcript_25096/g.85978  ORF Transcript_25096/g.85978 Transcript_25096/m.85978 type:complete len:234 (+) Transcript_25096:579-1280(+)